MTIQVTGTSVSGRFMAPAKSGDAQAALRWPLPDVTRAIRDGGFSRGNPPDSRSVEVFQKLLDRDALLPGDIILGTDSARFEMAPADNLIPGRYTHAAIYTGKDASGTPHTIEAWALGVQKRDARWWPRNYNTIAVLRPRREDGTQFSPEERQRVVDFAEKSIGCGYNLKWLTRDVSPLPPVPGQTRFYCSQLAWAAWKEATGVDICPPTWRSWRWATSVPSQEIYESPKLEHVAERIAPPVPRAAGNAVFAAGGVAGALAASVKTVGLLSWGCPGLVLSAAAGMVSAALGGVVAKSVADEVALVSQDPHERRSEWRGTAFEQGLVDIPSEDTLRPVVYRC